MEDKLKTVVVIGVVTVVIYAMRDYLETVARGL